MISSHFIQATKVFRYSWFRWYPGLAIFKAKIPGINIFLKQNIGLATLSNSTRKLLWFEIVKMLIAV